MGTANSTVKSGLQPGSHRANFRRLRRIASSFDQDEAGLQPIEHESREIEGAIESPESPAENIHFQFLDQCVQEISTYKLEARAKTATSVIDDIEKALQKQPDAKDAARFLTTIERLRSQNKPTKTVIGMLGDTGSGKSSIVNALLDEEMIVPTNCMRACTSVITELSYNASNDPDERYRAEVEFISPDDWRNELSQLSHDLLNGAGEVVRESLNAETEAGVSWAKINAVYPELTKESFADTNIDTLASTPYVQAVLGAKHIITDSDSASFFEEMQKYIDSDAQEGQRKRAGGRKQLQYWPLIKVVRIFVKADVLSTGAVIVDLPGVQDSNAARAAMAEKYIENCKYIWIVAPITRAVDDKTAQKLLGQTFKLQLKLDCKLDRVTFICSKTDEISVVEAAKSFRGQEDMSTRLQYLQRIEADFDKSREECQGIKDDLRQVELFIEQIQQQIDHWSEQLAGLDKGNMAQPYTGAPCKRKTSVQNTTPLKKRRIDLDSISISDSDISDGDNDPIKEEIEEKPTIREESPVESLTPARIWNEVNRLQREKTKIHEKQDYLHTQWDKAFDEHRRDARAKSAAEIDLKSLCIQSRNKFSKNAIQQDFARGIKESDQELAVRESEESFNPEHNVRDYKAIASSFPVFCVSSKAYQKLRGRFKRDEKVKGFSTLESTGMPQLRMLAKKLTESSREDIARSYMKNFRQFILTLSLWAQKKGNRAQLTEVMFKKDLDQLEMDLDFAAETVTSECRAILARYLYDKFDRSSTSAAKAALKTAQKWFGPRIDGGYAWNTYQAICIRKQVSPFRGVHTTRSVGHVDLNEDLAAPIKKLLANSWEVVFSARIPDAIAKFPAMSQSVREKFHSNVKGRIPKKDHKVLQASLMEHVRYEDIFKTFQSKVTRLQREANREFTPAVTRNMTRIYERCTRERGAGMYSRMKDTTLRSVKKSRSSMFSEATSGARGKLDAICDELESELSARITQSISGILYDFESGVIGSNLADASRAARVEVRKVLSTTDALFGVPVEDDRDVICLS
ncbi:hypothetical protein PFICI_07544 [Pestalotiopsis fici W106-1]|uniref:G domain-containing protein n=1 Tax=Pestalotiopsis fici (strain W106-1 / CGMCC3.15140) TaxID=1229662 RepID=W3X1R2_PESFW|nr:uncharacterized protein PFICI_07544 [Pestalotiopsis fici W106-1]ETS80015.1 hypothetical protein PFICI_07544 [Pestalotiopsis fici W106-1]